MSAYHAPNHNRLLDLERHLQHQQAGTTNRRKGPERQSVHQSQSSPRPKRQPKNQPLDFSHQQQRSKIGETSLPRQFRRNQPQSGVTQKLATPCPMHQKPRKIHASKSSGSYRQLATQMGKYYAPGKPHTQTPNNDLPVIPTPISQEVIENYTETAAPNRKPETITAPESASTQPPLQPRWTGLAMSIRQARLGINTAVSENNNLDSEFNMPSMRHTLDKTSVQIVKEEEKSQESGQQVENSPLEASYTAPVTIDVTPVAITSIESNPPVSATKMFFQDLHSATAFKREESTLEPVAEEEELSTKDKPNDNANVLTKDNLDDSQKLERPITVVDKTHLKGSVLQFYQRTCRPRILECFIQVQRKIHHLKETHGQG